MHVLELNVKCVAWLRKQNGSTLCYTILTIRDRERLCQQKVLTSPAAGDSRSSSNSPVGPCVPSTALHMVSPLLSQRLMAWRAGYSQLVPGTAVPFFVSLPEMQRLGLCNGIIHTLLRMGFWVKKKCHQQDAPW